MFKNTFQSGFLSILYSIGCVCAACRCKFCAAKLPGPPREVPNRLGIHRLPSPTRTGLAAPAPHLLLLTTAHRGAAS